MPTYEYECLECKHRFDVFHSMNENPVKACEKCNGKVRKLFGTAGLIFKGSGFYVNDYRKNGSEKTGSPSGDSQGCAAADSCPAAGCPGKTPK